MSAREELVRENLGLVGLCARRMRACGQEYDDLFQAGCVGLLKAAENFDPDRGFRFSTYAVPVILGEMRRLAREGGALRISRGLRDLARRVRETQDLLRRETGREPTLPQVAERLGISPQRAALALGAGREVASLSGEEGEEAQIPVDAPEEDLTERLSLREMLERLDEPDRRLLELRYYQGRTQTETGKALGLTQVQVSRREKKLLLYLRGQLLE